MKDYIFSSFLAPSKEPWLAQNNWDDLTRPFLSEIEDAITLNDDYYDDLSSTFELKETILRIENSNRNIHQTLLTGHVGSGKTSFIREFFETSKSTRNAHSVVIDGLNEERLENLPESREALGAAIAQFIACRLHSRFTTYLKNDKTNYLDIFKELSEEIRQQKSSRLDIDEFLEGMKNQSGTFVSAYPKIDGYVHLSIVSSAIFRVSQKSIWMVFDNVDLLPEKTRTRLFSCGDDIMRNITERCNDRNWEHRLRLLVVARPETANMHKHGVHKDFQSLIFPTPLVTKIAIRHLQSAIEKTVVNRNKNTPLTSSVLINGHTYNTWDDFGKLLFEAVENGVQVALSANKLNDDWHAKIVNFNVRRFIGHWPRIVLSAISIDSWILPKTEKNETRRHALKPHHYMRNLFKAGAEEYQGTQFYDASNDKSNGPLIVNLFDIGVINKLNKDQQIRNFLAPIRILQYFQYSDNSIPINEASNDLYKFFDENVVINSLRFFVWARLLDETKAGIRATGQNPNWSAIPFHANQENYAIRRNPSTEVYVTDLLATFEYAMTMAPLTPILVERAKTSTKTQPCQFTFHEHLLVLGSFLETLVLIAKRNIATYKNEGTINLFCSKWHTNTVSNRPISNLLKNARESIHAIKETLDESGKIRTTANSTEEKISRLSKEFDDFLRLELDSI